VYSSLIGPRPMTAVAPLPIGMTSGTGANDLRSFHARPPVPPGRATATEEEDHGGPITERDGNTNSNGGAMSERQESSGGAGNGPFSDSFRA
jgi:hypothetical protein